MRRKRVCLGLLFVVAALGCDDRNWPVGWWKAGNSSSHPPGMTPPGAGGASGAGGAPAPVDPPCPVTAAAMPVRPLTIPAAEIARRLAWLLRRAQPDAALIASAQGMMTSPEVGRLAERMLPEPASAAGLRALTQAWLQLEPVAAADPDLQKSMIEETHRFVQDLVASGGTVRSLLTSSTTFADARLGAIYGVAGLPQNSLVKVALNPMQRSGVLTQAGPLSSRPHATRRGVWVRDVFLCQPIPDPPPGVVQPVVQPPGTSYRQAFNQQLDQPACMGCHLLTDPVGFALENFEGPARWRTTDNGAPIDASGDLTNVRGLNGTTVVGPLELGSKLAASCDVHSCVARKFLAHALGRDLQMGDEPSAADVTAAFAGGGLSLRSLIISVVQSGAFLAP